MVSFFSKKQLGHEKEGGLKSEGVRLEEILGNI